jgi:hypothetical protein
MHTPRERVRALCQLWGLLRYAYKAKDASGESDPTIFYAAPTFANRFTLLFSSICQLGMKSRHHVQNEVANWRIWYIEI